MDCIRAQELILADYVDGKLAGEALEDVREHLSICASCRAMADGAASAGKLFRQAGREAPPDRVWRAVKSSVAALPTPRRALAPAFPFAMAALAILTIVVAMRLTAPATIPGAAVYEAEVCSMLDVDESGNGEEAGFGTAIEAYFL